VLTSLEQFLIHFLFAHRFAFGQRHAIVAWGFFFSGHLHCFFTFISSDSSIKEFTTLAVQSCTHSWFAFADQTIPFCAQIAQGIWDVMVPGCSRMSLLHCTNMIQYDPMVCMFFPTGFGGYVAGAKHSSQPEAWKQCEKCHLRIVAILMVPFPGVKPIFDVLKPSVLFDTCRKSPTGFALLGVNYQQLLIGLFGSIWSLCLCSVEWTCASMWEWNMGEIILEVLKVLKWMAW